MIGTRRTIASDATVRGTALHTGRPAGVRFRPATPGTGILFRRLDLDGHRIPATVEHVTATDRRTALGGPEGVQTIEHVLAAVCAASLDDLEIGVDGPEPPLGDGSALPFLVALQHAGVRETPGAASTPGALPLDLRLGEARYRVTPAAVPRLRVIIEFDHPLIGRQEGAWTLAPGVVARELAPARTFGFARDAAALARRGLAAGARPDNMVVLTADGLATGALRWPDEFVRHKALDLVGDLMLAGGVPRAEIVALRPSHAGNVALAGALRSQTLLPESRRDRH